MKHIGMAIAGLLVALLCASPVSGNYSTLLTKPQQCFFFLQSNVAGGYDEAEPGDGYGLADRGPKTQITFEWLAKDESRIQRGYTHLMAAATWNFKFGLEVDPAEATNLDPSLHLRLFDAWVQIDTRWDRTSLRLGHRNLPYGSNPRLDPEFDFLPNQASLDLGISRDTGVFFSTPVSASLDLRASTTLGGFLSGPLVSVRDVGDDSELEGNIDYRGSWLTIVDLSTPSFRPTNLGVFTAFGKLHRSEGALTDIARIGGYWIHKHRESWKTVHQVSIGRSDGDDLGERDVLDVLNNVEFFLTPRWSVLGCAIKPLRGLENLAKKSTSSFQVGTFLKVGFTQPTSVLSDDPSQFGLLMSMIAHIEPNRDRSNRAIPRSA